MANSDEAKQPNVIQLVEKGGKRVIFKASPEIDETGQALYVEVSEIRAPASLLLYMGSPSRTFNITGKFISRTRAEADTAFEYKSLLQAWRMPLDGFASGGLSGDDSGTVPRIVRLWGYGTQFNGIPTVVKSISISYPSDTDYILDSSGNDVPIVWPITVSLQEAHTMDDIKAFNYDSYKTGTLEEWS